MPNGDSCLSIGIDINQWKKMNREEKDEHIFFSLRYLVNEAKKNRMSERILTLIGTITANLVILIPVIWWVIGHVAQK